MLKFEISTVNVMKNLPQKPDNINNAFDFWEIKVFRKPVDDL